MPAGINFREGKKGTNFHDYNPFLLHVVKKQAGIKYEFKMTRN